MYDICSASFLDINVSLKKFFYCDLHCKLPCIKILYFLHRCLCTAYQSRMYTMYWYVIIITIDRERFAGLNIHSFSAIKVFAEIFSCCLGHKYSLFSINQESHLYSWKNFRGTPENREKCKSLAQQIFPHLWYDMNVCCKNNCTPRLWIHFNNLVSLLHGITLLSLNPPSLKIIKNYLTCYAHLFI